MVTANVRHPLQIRDCKGVPHGATRHQRRDEKPASGEDAANELERRGWFFRGAVAEFNTRQPENCYASVDQMDQDFGGL